MRYFEIQIPVKPNDAFDGNGNVKPNIRFNTEKGWLFVDSLHDEFEDFLLGRTDGYSKLPQISGVWKDPVDNTIYYDEMIPYRFATADNEIVNRIADFAKEHYEQIAIFIAEIGTAQIL